MSVDCLVSAADNTLCLHAVNSEFVLGNGLCLVPELNWSSEAMASLGCVLTLAVGQLVFVQHLHALLATVHTCAFLSDPIFSQCMPEQYGSLLPKPRRTLTHSLTCIEG